MMTDLLDGRQIVMDSQVFAYDLRVGLLANQLCRLGLARTDLEFRLRNGVLTAGYAGEEPLVTIGTAGTELIVDNWEKFITSAAGLPRKEKVNGISSSEM